MVKRRWAVVAVAINDRMDELALSQTDVARRAGLSAKTVRELQDAVEREYNAKTLRVIEQALEWPRGTIRALVNGTDLPSNSAQTATTVVRAANADEALAFIRECIDGLDPIDQVALLKRLAEELRPAHSPKRRAKARPQARGA